MMGFDPDEVMDSCAWWPKSLNRLSKNAIPCANSLREKELSVSEYRERDELLKSTITTATRMSEKIQVDAEREAKLIINDARSKGPRMIVRESRDSLKRIYSRASTISSACACSSQII